MKKRLLTAIVSLLIAVMLLFAASGCKKKNIYSFEPQKSAEIIIGTMRPEWMPGYKDDNQNNSDTASETPEPAKVKEIDYLVLVNKENKLPDDWEATVELVKVFNDIGDVETSDGQEYIRDREFEVEKTAYEAFQGLQAAMAEEGITILLDSTYRSVARQQEIWDEFMAEYGEEYTKNYVAVPGYSEHHTGLAIDICIVKDGKIINDNDEMIAEKEIFGKIHEKLADYGFILRYPEGMEEITGYSYEPWHFRYIGEAAAKTIAAREWTLEQYLTSGLTD